MAVVGAEDKMQREACRSVVAVRQALAHLDLSGNYNLAAEGAEGARTVRSAGSPATQSDLRSGDRGFSSSFVAWSSLWSSFVGSTLVTLHCLLVVQLLVAI
jgi:hypothetical protein